MKAGGPVFNNLISIIFGIALISSVANAKKQVTSKLEKAKLKKLHNLVFELEFKNKSGEAHNYKIIEESDKKQNEYLLTFVNENNAFKSSKLDRPSGEQIKAEALQIIWEHNYKAKTKANCTVYATLKLDKQTAKICNENLSAMGKTQSLLTRLNKLF
jgi:hypothetical protein